MLLNVDDQKQSKASRRYIWYMRIFIILLVFFVSQTSFAQSGRQLRPLYQLGSKYSNKAWHFAPGMTYMIPANHEETEMRVINSENGPDTLFNGSFKAKGKIGLYLEGGWAHFFDNPILAHYIDYGFHYKMLRGAETFDGMTKVDVNPVLTSNSGKFSEHYLGGFFHINRIIQLTDWTFVQASLGANLEYAVINKIAFDGIVGGLDQTFAERFQGQFNARIGFGYKAESGVFIIPSIETPILNVQPFYDGKSTLPFFSSRYRPIIFSIRFLFLKKQKAADCVGKGTEKRGHDLWGNDLKKRGR